MDERKSRRHTIEVIMRRSFYNNGWLIAAWLWWIVLQDVFDVACGIVAGFLARWEKKCGIG